MPFNAGGSTTRTTKTSGGTTWASDAAASNPINAAEFDTEAADIYAMLAKCITNDSNQTIAADISWNSKKITNLGDPSGAQDAATKHYVTANYLPFSGGTLTSTLTVSSGGIAVTGNSTITGTLGGITGLTVSSGGITATGNSTITGTLGGITGLTVSSGGATIGGSVTITPASGNGLVVHAVSGTHSMKIDDSTGATSYNAGYLESPINGQGTPYTAVLADSGKTLYYSSTGAATFTIPANASVAYPVGTILTFINDATGATNMTIAITTDTLVLSPGGGTGSRTLAQYGRAVAQKVSATRWVISGTGLT